MGQQLTISDQLFERLEAAARGRGLGSVEQLLEQWHIEEGDLSQRQEAVRQVDALFEELSVKYGVQPDSALLVRADRDR